MAQLVDPDKVENLEDFEKQFAVKAVEQCQTYWSLLEKIPGSKLKLTQIDDDIQAHVLEAFPEFKDKENVKVVDEDKMKSPEGKEAWRKFCMVYEKSVPDYNFGTLLRLDSSGEYDEKNTMFSVRIEFYAIEILRNRYGLNDWVHEQAKK